MKPVKTPILQNNFKTESGTPAKAAQNAPENAETDAVSASSNSPLRVGSLSSSGDVAERRKGPGEGSAGQPKPALERSEGKKRGPNTPEGKKAVSRNAVKHGIYSPHPVVLEDIESVEAWEEFHGGVVESLVPLGTYERELVEDIAWGYWRLRRCRMYETFQLNNQVEETEEEVQISDALDNDLPDGAPMPAIEPDRLLFHQQLKIIPDDRIVDRILRYETHVRRTLQQTVQELEVRQARRNGERTPLARVAFSSGPTLRFPGARGTARFTAIKQLNEDLNNIDNAIAERHSARAQIAGNLRGEKGREP